jgi:hypothetical protein
MIAPGLPKPTPGRHRNEQYVYITAHCRIATPPSLLVPRSDLCALRRGLFSWLLFAGADESGSLDKHPGNRAIAPRSGAASRMVLVDCATPGLNYGWHAAFAVVSVEGNLSVLNCGLFVHLTR